MSESEPPPPVLDYRGPAPRELRLAGSLWRRINQGEDSFLSCSALFFAIFAFAVVLFGAVFREYRGLAICAGGLQAALSTMLGLIALCEPRGSKTFPLAALALNLLAVGLMYGSRN